MKKLILIIFTLFVFFPLLAGAVPSAGELPTSDNLNLPKSPISEASQFLTIMTDIAKVVYYVFFVVAFIFIILAAFSYLTGGDEPEKIKTAHKQLTYAAIAIAVALIAVGANTIIGTFLKQ